MRATRRIAHLPCLLAAGRRRFLALGTPALIAAGALFLALSAGPPAPTPAQATTITVNIGDDWFSNTLANNCGTPCVTNIAAGDTVHWVWIGSSSHSATSDGGSAQAWDSGIHGNGFTFDVTFPNAGSFPYHCNVHGSMQGTIVVAGGAPTATPTNTPAPATPAPTTTSTPTSPPATSTNTPMPTTPAPTNTLIPTTPATTNTPTTPTDTPPAATSTATSPAPTATRTPTPAGLAGDANKDGRVDPIDAQLILQFAAGLIASINPNADANRDGQTNAIDAQLVLQFAAGLLSRLPP